MKHSLFLVRTFLCSALIPLASRTQNGFAAGCPAPTFAAPTVSAVGTSPIAAATGDFNGDGNLDLAVANQDGCTQTNQPCNSISILLGRGDGTFLPATNYPAGSYPTAIVAADFNGDGKLDLVVANSTDPGMVTVCLGNGNGTFQTGTNFSTGATPGSIAVGDFNEDNRLDLAVANYGSGSVSILLGNGNGTFKPATNYTTGSSPESVAVADFNEDHHLDLVVARDLSSGGSVVKLLGNGDGTFQAAGVVSSGLASPESVITGDFNNDGHADVAVIIDADPGYVRLLRGLGNGSFMTATNFSTGTYPISLRSGDFNGDGLPDFAVGDDTGISVLLGKTNGTFQATSGFGYASNSYYLSVGDFNGDGSLDLAAANYNANGTASLLLNNCVSPQAYVPVVLKSPTRQGDGLFHFIITSQAGAVLLVEASTNLTAWPQIAVVTNVTGTMDFADPASASLPRRFYRVGLPGTTPQTMTAAGLTRLPDGNIRFSVLGTTGQVFRVLANTNLSTTNWIAIATLTNASGSVQFTDTSASNFMQRYYRSVSP